MRTYKLLLLALLAVSASAGCKKKKPADTNPGSGSSGAMSGSGSDMGSAGSGSDMGSAAMGSGSDSGSGATPTTKAIVVMLPEDMKWTPMDPSAPDKAPSTAPLWGDMQGGPNGFLIKVPAKNPGMEHVHTNGYHGVTIMGSPNHLQDGGGKAAPLPPGSYWFEPGGANHNSQCPGAEPCLALVHFNDGKMDFAPAKLDPKGKPKPEYVEKRQKDLKWTPLDAKAGAKGPQVAIAWGDSASGPHGFFIKVPAGVTSPPHTHTADYHAVVIEGVVQNYAPDDKAPKDMPAGSYWMQPGGMPHVTACKAGKPCMSYGYMLGKFDFAPAGGDAGSAAAGSAAAGSGSAAAGSGSAM